MGEKWGFFLLFDAIIAHRCATMRYDSASPKTGAWPSLVATGCEAFVINDLLMYLPCQVQHYLKLSQETLYLGISLLDTILDKRDVEPDKLQLVESFSHLSFL